VGGVGEVSWRGLGVSRGADEVAEVVDLRLAGIGGRGWRTGEGLFLLGFCWLS
jgi:hypothetical protein